MTATKDYTRKIGRNKGKPRLWLEGAILSDNGFAHGARFTIAYVGDGSLRIIQRDGDTSPRKVSGKPDRPIIDITASSLAEIGQATIVKITAQERGTLKVERIA